MEHVKTMRAAVDATLPELFADLELMVNIDCGSRDKAGVDRIGGIVQDRLRVLGCDVSVYPEAEIGDHLLGELRGAGGPDILIVSHMDTVFPTGTAAQRPYAVNGDRATGPGVADMKAGLLAGLYAVKALKSTGFDQFGAIRLVFNSDEEIGSTASRALIEAQAKRSLAALITEPARAGGEIVSARKGTGLFEIKVTGVSAHAGVEPQKGRSANLELAHKVIALHALNDYAVGTTVNVGVMSGGIARNVVASEAKGLIDVRVPNVPEMTRLEAAFAEIQASSVVEGCSTTISGRLNRPPMPKNAAVQAMLDLARPLAAAIGFELKDIATGGGSDGNFTAGLGVPMLDGVGPQGGAAHSPDEYLIVSSVAPRTTLLALMIREAVLNANKLRAARGV